MNTPFSAELVSSSPAPAAAPVATPAPATTPEPNTPAPAPVTTPEAVPTTVTNPEPTTPTTEPAPVEQKLYDLPDGRKVDGETLQREWKQNFLPDYTRKSQELARLKSNPITNPAATPAQPANPEAKPWEDPNWQPKSWGEVVSLAEQQALDKLSAGQREEQERQAVVNSYFDSQMEDIKKTDPKADQDSIYAHATKFGFTDLKMAHANLKEIQNVRMTTEQSVLKNIQSRANEPVASTTSKTVDDGTVDPGVLGRFSSAQDVLRSLKK